MGVVLPPMTCTENGWSVTPVLTTTTLLVIPFSVNVYIGRSNITKTTARGHMINVRIDVL